MSHLSLPSYSEFSGNHGSRVFKEQKEERRLSNCEACKHFNHFPSECPQKDLCSLPGSAANRSPSLNNPRSPHSLSFDRAAFRVTGHYLRVTAWLSSFRTLSRCSDRRESRRIGETRTLVRVTAILTLCLPIHSASLFTFPALLSYLTTWVVFSRFWHLRTFAILLLDFFSFRLF